MDKENIVYIHNGILFDHEKGEHLTICDNMDGPWGHYAKWNKPDRERQVFYDPTDMWNLKTSNSQKEGLLPESGGWEKRGDVGERL